MLHPVTGNYHTHTKLCRHAKGMPVDYARVALKRGLKHLGISDHTPLPDDRWLGVRMCMSDLETYKQSIEDARQQYPGLNILSGLECEYIPEFHNFYSDELLGTHGFDYLIYAPHWFLHKGEWLGIVGQSDTPDRLISYGKHAARGMETGLFAFMAHPDIFGNDYLTWDESATACSRDILSAAEELDIPLEINGLGFRRGRVNTPAGERNMYPWNPFWKIAQDYRIDVTVNSDAHRPEDVTANMNDALRLANRFQLNVVDMCDRIT